MPSNSSLPWRHPKQQGAHHQRTGGTHAGLCGNRHGISDLKSTRRGLEPWRIVAIFTSAGREIHAEWTWNMHDNSVMSLNNAARNRSANRIRSWRCNSNSSRRFPNCPATPYAPRVSSAPCLLGRLLRLRFRPHGLPNCFVTSTGSMPPVDLSTSISPATTQAHGTTDRSPVSSQTAGSVSPSAAGLQQSPATAPEQGSDNVSDKTIRSGPDAQLVATEQERAAESAATEHEAPAKPAKRKSGRSAVPSWDEILFGD